MHPPQLWLLLPEYWQARLALPLITQIPPAQGRKLPNGTLLVEDRQDSAHLYKFVPWPQARLALNEIDIYARLHAQGADFSHIVPLKAIGATQHYLVRQVQRASQGSLDRFLLNRAHHAKNAHGENAAKDQCLLSCEQICALLLPVAQALAQLHARDILHRDLKAENILVFSEQEDQADISNIALKLADFDRALYLPKGEYLQQPVGSLLHMAPELLCWQPYDHKIDVYAFAMLLFEVAHGGRQPHANIGSGMPGSITRKEFAEQVVHKTLRPNWLHPSTPLKQLAQSCWQANPAQRPECTHILEQLTAWAKPRSKSGAKPSSSLALPTELGVCCHIGKVRTTMEDAAAVLLLPQGMIAAVFDGLLGADSSAFAAHQLPLLLASALKQYPGNIEKALQQSFQQAESTLQALHPQPTSGTTATLALLQKETLWLAWLGDSPAWLVAGQRVTELTCAHHPQRAEESARIHACGARVGRESIWLDNGEQMPSGPPRVYFPKERTEGGIALSRALGVFSYKPAIGHQPQILRHALTAGNAGNAADAPARFLLLSSDGVLGFLDKASICKLLLSASCAQQAAQRIMDEVLKRGAADNASLIVVDVTQWTKCAQ